MVAKEGLWTQAESARYAAEIRRLLAQTKGARGAKAQRVRAEATSLLARYERLRAEHQPKARAPKFNFQVIQKGKHTK